MQHLLLALEDNHLLFRLQLVIRFVHGSEDAPQGRRRLDSHLQLLAAEGPDVEFPGLFRLLWRGRGGLQAV